MKKLALRAVAGLLLLACCCVPAVAQASETANIHVAFVPYKLGAGTTIKLNVNIGTTTGEPPGPVTEFDMHIPPELELIGSSLGLSVCQPDALATTGPAACPANAQIGTGSAQVVTPFGPETLSEGADISMFMGPPQGEDIGVLLFAEGRMPIFAQLVFPGVVIIGKGPVGESLNTSLPLTPTLPGARDASVTNLRLNIGPEHLTYYTRVHGRRVSYSPTGISLPSVCPRGGFQFVSDMSFQDGTKLRAATTVPCPPSHRQSRR